MKHMLKNLKPNGLLLYTRDRHMVCSKYDKMIDLPETGFKQPSGIAMNAEFIFVCDKELASVSKIDIVSGLVVQSIGVKNGTYYSLETIYFLNTSLLRIII